VDQEPVAARPVAQGAEGLGQGVGPDPPFGQHHGVQRARPEGVRDGVELRLAVAQELAAPGVEPGARVGSGLPAQEGIELGHGQAVVAEQGPQVRVGAPGGAGAGVVAGEERDPGEAGLGGGGRPLLQAHAGQRARAQHEVAEAQVPRHGGSLAGRAGAPAAPCAPR